MEVMLIKQVSKTFKIYTGEILPIVLMNIGDWFNVIDERTDIIKGRIMYELAEFPPNKGRKYFCASLFAKKSMIDELNLVGKKEEAYA